MKTVFLRALEADDKQAGLMAAIRAPHAALLRIRFEVEPAKFARVPLAPFAYWVSDRLRDLFVELPALEAEGRTARVGLQTSDDFRFVRLWWAAAAAATNTRWYLLAKGGSFSPFYADVFLVVNWDEEGREVWAFPKAFVRNQGFFFRPGLTWPGRTNGLSLRVLPPGCVFTHKGPAIFLVDDRGQDMCSLAAVTNSAAFGLLVSLQLARTELAQSFEVGLIQRTPVPQLTAADTAALAALARRAWSLKRSLDTRTETSHAFTLPALLQVPGLTLAARSAAWFERGRVVEAELAAIQAEIDARCFDLYGIDEADRRAISDGFGAGPDDVAIKDAVSGEEEEAEEAEEAESDLADAASLAAELVSWAVGVAFGRFDVRLATGARAMPVEPDPFAELPICSPAMLTGSDGLPLATAPAGSPVAWPADGLLVDDPGHPRDLATAVRNVFDVIFGDAADALWQEAAALLDPRGRELRSWLAKGFFEHHLKRHSKSRRQAPVLWQLATPSASYSVWLYAHRLTKDSLYQVQNDHVLPRLALEERRHTALVQDAGPNPTASQRRELATRESVISELRAFKEELARVTALWEPDLNDGVVLTMAPLWRLVPQHKPWQKELKARWDKLCAGTYDWAHLAMQLWPERVIAKCPSDRSLAIAHGLEDVFWIEEQTGTWASRKKPTRPPADLVRERTSPAAQAALQNLIGAPTAASGAQSQRAKRAS